MLGSSEKTLGFKTPGTDLESVMNQLCVFAPTGSGTYVRELHEFLALHALAMLPAEYFNTRAILEKIKTSLGRKFEYEEILEALNSLATKKQLLSKSNADGSETIFAIPIEIRHEVKEKVESEKVLERKLLEEWKYELKNNYKILSNEDLESLIRDLRVFSIRLFSQHSAESLELYYGKNDKLAAIINALDPRDVKQIWELRDDPYQSIRNREVIAFFREADDKRKRYIASLMQAVFLFQLTHLDPSCAEIVRAEIPSDGVIYLDTNFVFRLIGLQGPELFLAAKKLAEASISLGYKLVISPKTKSEYENTLKGFLKEVKRYPMVTSELASLALDATSDEDFLTSYWKQVKEAGAYVDPEQYFDYYVNIIQILKQFNVSMDETLHEEIITTRSSEISAQATHLRSIMELYFGKQSTDRVSDFVLEHDVYHRILIVARRGKINDRETFINTKFWFLTCDSKLPVYDRSLRSTQFNKMPFCVLSGQWFQTINPIVNPKENLEQISADLIASPLLRAYQRPSSSLIQAVIGRVSMRSTYTPVAVSAMLSNSQFLESYQDAKSEITQDELIDSFYASYAVQTELELKSTKSELESTRAEKEQVELRARKTIEELEEAQRRAVQDKIEKEEYRKKLEITSAETSKKIIGLSSEKDSYKSEAASLRKIINIFIGILITAGWIIYFLLRKPLGSASSPAVEVAASLVASAYIYVAIYSGLWKRRKLLLFIILVPLLFLASLFVPEKYQAPLQLLDGVIAIVVYVIDSLNKDKN